MNIRNLRPIREERPPALAPGAPRTGPKGRPHHTPLWVPWSKDQRPHRRAAAVHAYVGPMGSGKSLAAVHDSLVDLDKGRTVYSTVDLYETTGKIHPNYVPLTSWRQVVDARKATFILDEVLQTLNNRQSAGLPTQVQMLIVQCRRRDNTIRWTSPSYAHADKDMRRVTQAVTVCRGFMPKTSRDEDREWVERRLFRWDTYDAQDWEELTAGKIERAKRECRQLFWRPGCRAETSYDTLADVRVLSHLSEAGVCAYCNGRRRHASCPKNCPGRSAHEPEDLDDQAAGAHFLHEHIDDDETGDDAGDLIA